MAKIPPYHLRLNKAVDRFLLIDILRCFTKHELDQYWYAGLGGPFLEDFKLLDTFFPTLKKVSFETDEQVFLRQRFNRPSRLIRLVHGDMIKDLSANVGTGAPLIVWFDSTSSLPETFEGFIALLDMVPDNSLVRVTTRLGHCNSNPHGILISPLTQSLKTRVRTTVISEKEQRNLEEDIERIVREQIEHSLPQRVELDRISRYLPTDYIKQAHRRDGMAKLILGAFHQAVIEVFPTNGHRSYRLLNASQYSDGTTMLSITGAVLTSAEEKTFMRRFSKTPFATADWTDDPMEINLPILTPKERLHLSKRLPITNDPGKKLMKQLGFSIDPKSETCEHEMEMYNRFYRYYPMFARVAL